jgi:glycosyltransferase involved in cell wall biosynthesis
MSPERVQASDAPIASVVIPAHNEATVLGRLLDALMVEMGDGRLQVIVACNGCNDNTAEVARKRGATVVEVEVPSKTAALNAGDDAATVFPRLYIDADVVANRRTITDLITALSEPGVLCAAPPFHTETAGRPWVVRAYFSVWSRIPYLKDGYVGSGIYAVSRKGRERFGRFPNIIADDLFIRSMYTRGERRVVATEPFIVQAPWTVRALFRRRVRINVGNMELSTHLEIQEILPGRAEKADPWWRDVINNPLLYPAAIMYASINLVASCVAKKQLRGKGPIEWGRDDTTRSRSEELASADSSLMDSR